MKRFIRTVIVTAVSLGIVDYVLGGLGFPDYRSIIATALLLGLINATVKPILKVLAIPFNLLSFGLFSFILNGLILMFAVNYSGGNITSIVSAIIASLVLSFVNGLVEKIFS